jgi:hypothetical protein
MVITWEEGIDSYKINTLEINNIENIYTVELCDRELPTETRNFSDIIFDCFKYRDTKTVEILYSGGLDSELVLKSCIKNKIPVSVITMKLYIDNVLINSHDLYYSEKFCRENNLTQKFVDFHARSFYENGDYINYLKPYYITSPHVASHMWLIEQCGSFPIMCGDYSWPQHTNKILSPHRLSYNSYSRFMKDRNITGIGNVLNHSLELNIKMMQHHIQNYTDPFYIMLFKCKMYNSFGLGTFEPRMRSFGWEYVNLKWFDRMKYKTDLIKMCGEDKPIVKWGKKIAEVLGGEPGSNDKF